MSVLRQSIKCYLARNIPRCSLDLQKNSYSRQRLWRMYCSSGAISHPTADDCEKLYSQKIKTMVDDISKLTLIEVADLNECLKKRLKIKDVPMMMGAPIAAPSVAPGEQDESEAEVAKSSYTVKLMSFDPPKKIALIKEVKSLIEGFNLVQAKSFIESCPQIIKGDVTKEEAESMKKALEAVGGTCEIS